MMISFVLPSLNEEEAVASVISEIKKTSKNYESEIILVDSGTDQTAEIARKLGVDVYKVNFKGYGNQLRYGLQKAKGDIIVISDCDGTYPIKSLPRFLKKIEEGYDLVTGNRLLIGKRNIPLPNVFANHIFSYLLKLLFHIHVEDISTGMKVFTKQVNTSIRWKSDCELPVEMLIKPSLYGYKIAEIAIKYNGRKLKAEESKYGM
jgi:glycosyltransferase involved in cell wall biosynthesis